MLKKDVHSSQSTQTGDTMPDTAVENTLSRAVASALIGTVFAYYLDNWSGDKPLPEEVSVEMLFASLEVMYSAHVFAEQVAVLPILKDEVTNKPDSLALLRLKVHAYIRTNAENIMLGAQYDAIPFGRMIVAILSRQQLNHFIAMCHAKAALAKAAKK